MSEEDMLNLMGSFISTELDAFENLYKELEEKDKEIQELKEENEFLKLSNPEMNIEHSRYVKENKRKIDNLRLVNKRLNNIINELEKDIKNLYTYGIKNNAEQRDYLLNRLEELKELKGSDK